MYADESAAHDATAGVATAAEHCALTGPDAIAPVSLDSQLGEESFAWVDQYRDGGKATGDTRVWQVSRTGNALLLDHTYRGELAADGTLGS